MCDVVWFVVSLITFVLGYVSGWMEGRDEGPPPHNPDSASYKRGT